MALNMESQVSSPPAKCQSEPHGLSPAHPSEEQVQPKEEACLVQTTEDEEVDEIDVLITPAMIAEEEQLHLETESEEKKLQVKAADKLRTKEKRFKQLQHLLTKSKVYTQFLLEKMEQQQEADKLLAERGAKRQNKRARTKSTASPKSDLRKSRGKTPSSPKVADDAESSNSMTSSVKSSRKRKHELFKVSDYMAKEDLEKIKSEIQLSSQDLPPEGAACPSATEEKSVRQPNLLTGGVMRSYQIAGFEWLKVLYENGVNGILADEMGLGKTVQCIALFAHLIEMGVPGPYLIGAPLSTLPNWVAEFHRFTPSIPTILYHGSKDQRMELRKQIKLRKNSEGYAAYPVIVTSYEVLMKDRAPLQKYCWKYIVLDEGHRIKNIKCRLVSELKRYQSVNRLLLTGTPLQNNLAELWSLLHFLLPEIFDNLQIFESWFDVGVLNGKDANEQIVAQEQEKHILSMLHDILTPFLLRRMKCDVELFIPPKKELLVYAPLTPKQEEYYRATVSRTIWQVIGRQELSSVEQISEQEDSGARYKTRRGRPKQVTSSIKPSDSFAAMSVANIKLQNIMMQLRKCCNHPYLLNFPLDPRTGMVLIDEELIQHSGKLLVLDAMLPKLRERGHKVLLFSQMTMLLDILADYCELRGYSYGSLDGRMKLNARQEEMASFNKDPEIFLFLVSTRAGGLGLNLTGADTVIIYDSDWNPQCDLQAQDRCHRIGQTKPVVVYRLITANTIDQRIVERAASKRKLEKMIIHKDKFKNKAEKSGKILNTNELLELLKSTDYDGVVKTRAAGQVFTEEEVEALLDRSDMMGDGTLKTSSVSSHSSVFKVVEVDNKPADLHII